jgi:hypothetical protein
MTTLSTLIKKLQALAEEGHGNSTVGILHGSSGSIDYYDNDDVPIYTVVSNNGKPVEYLDLNDLDRDIYISWDAIVVCAIPSETNCSNNDPLYLGADCLSSEVKFGPST